MKKKTKAQDSIIVDIGASRRLSGDSVVSDD